MLVGDAGLTIDADSNSLHNLTVLLYLLLKQTLLHDNDKAWAATGPCKCRA